ncbi:hypothetical protein WA171_005089 [Blastocystis sp. BT1]
MFRSIRAFSIAESSVTSFVKRSNLHSLPSTGSFTGRTRLCRDIHNTFIRCSRSYRNPNFPLLKGLPCVRQFTTAVEAKEQEAAQQPSAKDLATLDSVMTYIRNGAFEYAREELQRLENPKLFRRDIYYLTLYLTYMTDSFRTMTPEQIQQELDKCGLTEEQIKKMGHRLRHPTAQQYILEKNLLSGTNNVLTWCLTILAVYLLFLLFANINPGNFLQTSSFEPETGITTRFSDVIGLGESLDEVQMLVKYLQDPMQFRRMGAKTPTGVLLTGPPGTGKTLLARAVAGEASVPFFFAAGSEFDEMYVGMGAKRVRELFKKARENAPCIVFIDELDAVGGRRDSFRGSNSRQTINQLLNEIGGFRGDEGVLIIAATNLKKVLDPALVRAGRFDLEIRTSLPDREARERILLKKTQQTRLAEDVDIPQLARRTVGFSGAELESLMNVAAMKALAGGYLRIHNAHIMEAYDRIKMGSRGDRGSNPDIERMTLLHECGHALVSLLTPGSMPIDKITVIPRGDALGYVAPLAEEKDMVSQTKEQLLAMMDTAMGGRAAEEVFYGADNVTTGASSDLQQASSIARGMVYEWGMNGTPRVRGEVSGASIDQLPYYGEEQRKKKDMEINRMLDESYQRARTLIEKNKRLLLRLADAVEENETISGEDAKRILRGEPMKDVYNVDELKFTDDDVVDAEIYQARYKGTSEEQRVKEEPLVTEDSNLDEVTSMIAKEMLAIRLDEEKQVFEALLRQKAAVDRAEEDDQVDDNQEEEDREKKE